MSKYKFGIMHLPINTYLKWWLDKRASIEQFIVGFSNENPATLINCLKAPFISFKLLGKTEQGVNVEGKNKLKLPNGTYSNNGITAEVIDGELTLNGTANGNAIIYIPFAYSFKAQAYTLSFNNPVASTAVILRFDSNIMPETAGIINRTYSYTFSEITNVSNFVVRVASGNTVTNFKLKPMLEEGLIASPYVPYNCIQIKKCNKNFCKLDEPNLLMNSNNVIVSSNYPTTIINTKNITSLCVTGDFTLLDYKVLRACGTNEYPALGVSGTRLTNIGSNNNIIGTTNFNYIMLTWIVSGAITEELKQAIENSFQVEEGTVPSPYIKHTEKTYNFPLSEGQSLAENEYIDKNGIHSSELIPLTPVQQAEIDEIINDGTYKEVTHIEATANINPFMEIEYKQKAGE